MVPRKDLPLSEDTGLSNPILGLDDSLERTVMGTERLVVKGVHVYLPCLLTTPTAGARGLFKL